MQIKLTKVTLINSLNIRSLVKSLQINRFPKVHTLLLTLFKGKLTKPTQGKESKIKINFLTQFKTYSLPEKRPYILLIKKKYTELKMLFTFAQSYGFENIKLSIKFNDFYLFMIYIYHILFCEKTLLKTLYIYHVFMANDI